MRRDMAKVIVERPRRGSSACYKEVRRKQNRGDPKLLPTHQGMRRPYLRGNQKEFSDLLGPIYRFLEGKVGHPWNDVFSEICRHVSARTTTHQHVRDHIDQFVAQHCYRDRYGVVRQGRYGGRVSDQLYVDPDNGILKRAPKGPA